MKKALSLLLLCISFTSFAQVTYIKEGRTNPAAGPTDLKVRELRQDTTNSDPKKRGIYSIRSGTPDQFISPHPTAVKTYIKDSLQAIRDKGSAIKLSDHGWGRTMTGSQNKAALTKAIARAKLLGVKWVEAGGGTFTLDPFDFADDSIGIRGVSRAATKIMMGTTAGDAVFRSKTGKGITIQGMTIDCINSSAAGSGGIWISGEGNLVDNVEVRNADGFGIVVSGSYSDGVTFVPTLTRWNVVRNFIIRGERRYHSIGAKYAAGTLDSAAHTLFENGLLIDNFVSGETGDYLGSDHAVYSHFKNMVCIKTTAGMGEGAGLHLEGDEPYDNMYVTTENLTVINMTVGTSVSQNTKARFVGNNRIIRCKYPIKSYAAYTPTFSGFELIDCGQGLESSDTEGLINNSTSGIYQNITTTGTLARCAFVNYNGNSANSVTTMSRLENCRFDKYVRLSYTNVGSYFMQLSGCSFVNTRVDWYNNVGLRVDVANCFFNNSTISGAVVGYATVGGGTRFYTTNSALVAIDLTTGGYNTQVSNAIFEGYNKIGDNVTYGTNIVQLSITNPAPIFNGNGGSVLGNLAINTPGSTSSLTLEDGILTKTIGAGFYFNSGLVAPPSLVGPGVSASDGPSSKAALEVRSNTRGFLPPRMTTTERTALSLTSTEDGLMVQDITLHKLYVWDGTAWQAAW